MKHPCTSRWTRSSGFQPRDAAASTSTLSWRLKGFPNLHFFEDSQASSACGSDQVTVKINTKHWWKNTKRLRWKKTEINHFHRHFVHRKSHMDWSCVEHGPHDNRPTTNHLSHGTTKFSGLKFSVFFKLKFIKLHVSAHHRAVRYKEKIIHGYTFSSFYIVCFEIFSTWCIIKYVHHLPTGAGDPGRLGTLVYEVTLET